MLRIVEECLTWSVFNEEKQINFNGYYLLTPRGHVLIDPPVMSDQEISEVEFLAKPIKIYLTNKHHTRASAAHRERWGVPIHVHQDDAPLMEIKVDGTFADGEILEDALEVVRIPDAKTPGECAFYWTQQKILIVGDAMIGKPGGALSILPDEKFKNPELAKQGLAVLRGLDYDKLLVGDGQSILSGAKPMVDELIQQLLAAS